MPTILCTETGRNHEYSRETYNTMFEEEQA